MLMDDREPLKNIDDNDLFKMVANQDTRPGGTVDTIYLNTIMNVISTAYNNNELNDYDVLTLGEKGKTMDGRGRLLQELKLKFPEHADTYMKEMGWQQ